MKCFTQPQLQKLLENGANPDQDHPPVVKLSMTFTNCIWLISEINPDYPEIGFGLCDLGMGFPELGYVGLDELQEAQDFLRVIKNDESFEPKYPMSVYSAAARQAECIVTDEVSLKQAIQLKP